MRKSTKIVIDDQLKEIREKLKISSKEMDHYMQIYNQYDSKGLGQLSRNEIDDFMRDLQLYKRSQAQKFVQDQIKNDGQKTYELKQVLELVIETKKFIEELEEEEFTSGEYLDAFIAMGGNPDRSGYVQKKTIIDIIQNEFELTFNIEEFLEDLDSMHQIDFETFCQVFEHAGDDAKSVISNFSQKARQTWNVKMKDFEKWEAQILGKK